MSLAGPLIVQSKLITEHLVAYGEEPVAVDPKQSANLKRAVESAKRLIKMIKQEMEQC